LGSRAKKKEKKKTKREQITRPGEAKMAINYWTRRHDTNMVGI
jgi:hypothetical protein